MSRGGQAEAIGRLPRPLLLGHRGLNTVAPENTLAAIDAAVEAGAQGVEIDVRPCGTGELVVIHDPTVHRLTGGADDRPVSDLSLRELHHISTTVAQLGPAGRVPVLEEVVTRCRDHGLALNVEMKRDVPSRTAVVRACARSLTTLGAGQPIVVSSFDPAMLVGLRLLAPRLPLALLLHRAGRHYRFELLARPLGAVAIHVERTMVRPAQVERWRRLGMRVVAWTVNHRQEVRDLHRIGVDGFISDDPAHLVPELERLAARHGPTGSY